MARGWIERRDDHVRPPLGNDSPTTSSPCSCMPTTDRAAAPGRRSGRSPSGMLIRRRIVPVPPRRARRKRAWQVEDILKGMATQRPDAPDAGRRTRPARERHFPLPSMPPLTATPHVQHVAAGPPSALAGPPASAPRAQVLSRRWPGVGNSTATRLMLSSSNRTVPAGQPGHNPGTESGYMQALRGFRLSRSIGVPHFVDSGVRCRHQPAGLPATASSGAAASSFGKLSWSRSGHGQAPSCARSPPIRKGAPTSPSTCWAALRRVGGGTGVRRRTHPARPAGAVPRDAHRRALQIEHDSRLLLYPS